MKSFLRLVLVAFAMVLNTVGCGGGGNTVEYPENPDPMPGPPKAAGMPGPSEQPKASEQPKTPEQLKAAVKE
jgi:hypothetical protein